MAESPIRQEQMHGQGVMLNVARAGKGAPVVLLHGFPEFWYSWHHQIGPLAENGFEVFAPDMRGYNLSDKPPTKEDYHLRLLVEDVACLVRASGSPKAHIVGHDWGGVVAWAFAGKYPELVDKFVVMNAPHSRIYRREVARRPQIFMSWYVLFFQLPWLPERLFSADNYAAIREIFGRKPSLRNAFPPEDIEKYVEAISQPGALTAALNYYRCLVQSADGGKLARDAKVNAESLIIWGEQDHALCIRLLDGIKEYAPKATIHRIKESGHWVQNEAPEEVNRVLLDFLGK